MRDKYGLQCELLVGVGTKEICLPEWALAMISMGKWCRSFNRPAARLVTVLIVPQRKTCAGFAALGALLAGAQLHESYVPWQRFRDLPPSSVVYWRARDTRLPRQGKIIDLMSYEGAEFISVEITKSSKKADIGTVFRVSESSFSNCGFSLEALHGRSAEAALLNAQKVFELVTGADVSQWIMDVGSEALLITGMSSFYQDLESVTIRSTPDISSLLSELLCAGRMESPGHAKLRITHPRAETTGKFPLAILDGREAFGQVKLVNAENILILLERSEFTENESDFVMQLHAASTVLTKHEWAELPAKLPAGIEAGAWIIN